MNNDSLSRHVSERDLQGYRQRTLSPVDLLAVDDHLALCDICRERLVTEPPHTTTRSSGGSSSSSNSDEPSPSAAMRALWVALHMEIEAEPDETE